MVFKRIPPIYRLLGLVVVPFILLFLPASFFDQGQSICLSVLLLHRTCPGCGLTRALQHAIHVDFATAWQYNKLVIIIAPLLVWLWLQTAVRLYKTLQIKSAKKND